MTGRWMAAIGLSLALVVSAPFVGDVQRWLERALGTAYVPAINLGVAAVTGLAIVGAAARIRDRRLARYALILAAVALAAVFAWRTGLTSARSSAVERFHFVEYGVITWLFYRATMTRRDQASTALAPGNAALFSPVACAFAVATGDEWLQHLAPGRIGELRDIFMNAAAIVCGLLVSVAVVPPGAATARAAATARRSTTIATAICAVGLATFIYTVHVGTLVADDEVAFLSRFDAASLRRRAAGAGRADALASVAEDQYVTEAIWHVQARNAWWEAGDIPAAWGENRILEKYFAPMLAAGHAWPPAQRADAERRLVSAGRPTPYRSHAERIPIWQLGR